MNTQLFIPQKCKAGFNLRTDTYSGKLAYVIAWDGKKWRKETSWEGWRQKEGEFKDRWGKKGEKYGEEVNPLEFDNVPTSGFVLNKKVGGTRSDWNTRQTYARVYDPRGFEFEINIINLLYILENCNCMKGKGLEGEFVYSWDGKDLVLLPCSSWEYEKATNYTKLQGEKVSAKTLVPGRQYKTKKEEIVVYVGRFDWYDWQGGYYRKGDRLGKKYHIFTEDNGKTFLTKSGLDFLAEKVSDDIVSNYAEIIEKLQKNTHSSKIIKWEVIPVKINTTTKDHYSQITIKEGNYFSLDGDILQERRLNVQADYDYNLKQRTVRGFYWSEGEKLDIETQKFIRDEQTQYSWSYQRQNPPIYQEEDIQKFNYGLLYITLENGKRIKIDRLHNI